MVAEGEELDLGRRGRELVDPVCVGFKVCLFFSFFFIYIPQFVSSIS